MFNPEIRITEAIIILKIVLSMGNNIKVMVAVMLPNNAKLENIKEILISTFPCL